MIVRCVMAVVCSHCLGYGGNVLTARTTTCVRCAIMATSIVSSINSTGSTDHVQTRNLTI